MFKVLYIGGIYPTEYSLYLESRVNSNFELVCCGCEDAMADVLGLVDYRPAHTREAIDAIKDSFNPDLTLVRTWSPSHKFIQSDEVSWSQEITPTYEGGTQIIEGGNINLVAYQSRARAIQTGKYWMPYCVSPHFEIYVGGVRDIDMMVSTNLPVNGFGGEMKAHSCDILVQPLIEKYGDRVHVYTLQRLGGLHYLRGQIRAPYSPTQTPSMTARAKIYLSPTTIWHDEGCVSQKTLVAMATGALTVTNKYIGIEEVFGKDGETILYCNTPEETLSKVEYYLDHDKERWQLARYGSEFVHENFQWEYHLKRLYDSVKGEIGRTEV